MEDADVARTHPSLAPQPAERCRKLITSNF
jgi:hypothetical protein